MFRGIFLLCWISAASLSAHSIKLPEYDGPVIGLEYATSPELPSLFLGMQSSIYYSASLLARTGLGYQFQSDQTFARVGFGLGILTTLLHVDFSYFMKNNTRDATAAILTGVSYGFPVLSEKSMAETFLGYEFYLNEQGSKENTLVLACRLAADLF